MIEDEIERTGRRAAVHESVLALPARRGRLRRRVRAEGRRTSAPERAPDATVESPTLPQQALLYRLSGDKNPLHADPEFAKLGGFDRPILHGLCSFGIVCKAVVDAALGGDVARVARYAARFAGVLFPGETLARRCGARATSC